MGKGAGAGGGGGGRIARVGRVQGRVYFREGPR